MKLKAYFWKSHEDAENGIAVIAESSKEAKKLGAAWWGAEVGHDEFDWYIQQRIKLTKEAKVDCLSKGVIEGKEGMRRGLYSWLEDEECEVCHEQSRLVNVWNNKCICSTCEEKTDDELHKLSKEK
jgi:hypothetical protein